MTARQTLLTALLTQLQTIQIANDFQTDAGLKVFFGETPELGEADPTEAIALVAEDSDPKWQKNGLAAVMTLPLTISALVKAEREYPGMTAEAILSDIRKAIEIDDRTYGRTLAEPLDRGAVRSLKREPGSTTVGVSVTYIATMKEGWGVTE